LSEPGDGFEIQRCVLADCLMRTATGLHADDPLERKRADRFDLGEVFLEIALVITSITLLSGRRVFWHLGLVMGAIGVVLAVTGFLVH